MLLHIVCVYVLLHIVRVYGFTTALILFVYLSVFLLPAVCVGVLIVSVQWRNKTFSGSLIDMNQHEWAPPRYIHTLSCLSYNHVDLHTVHVQWNLSNLYTLGTEESVLPSEVS